MVCSRVRGLQETISAGTITWPMCPTARADFRYPIVDLRLLVAIWNSLAGVRPVKRFPNHKAAAGQQVLLYRLALGHPNQEDLLEILQRDHEISSEQVRKASLELSAYFGDSSEIIEG